MNRQISKQITSSLQKRIFISLLCLGLAAHITGCASGSSEEASAGGDETFAEEGSGDYADDSGDSGDSGGGDDSASGEETEVAEDGGEKDLGEEVADSGGDDLGLDDEGSGEAKEGDVAAKDGAEDDLSLDDEEGLPEDVAANAAPTEPAPIDNNMAAVEATPAPTDTPPTDAQVFNEVPPSDTSAPPAAPTSFAPLKKMKTEAFKVGDTNLNRVYLARPGETRPAIAEKIYGDKSRSKDLLKWNGFLSRGVKTGDKIYYQSPSNPTDTNMMTYYEDMGVPAQNYTSREGDNIREVSKTLLGDKDSWKEVWSTNPEIESKGNIPAGLNVRYWPEGSVAAPVVAKNDPTPPPIEQPPIDPVQPPPVEQPPVAMETPPPIDPIAQMTPVPVESAVPAVGQVEPPPPPPPVDPPVATEPAPAPPAHAKEKEPPADMAATGTEEADNMMMMGLAGIVLLAAGSVFMLMRRNRSRKVDLTQTTQVG